MSYFFKLSGTWRTILHEQLKLYPSSKNPHKIHKFSKIKVQMIQIVLAKSHLLTFTDRRKTNQLGERNFHPGLVVT